MFSPQAISGAVIASVMFAIGLATWLRDRRDDNNQPEKPQVTPDIQSRPAAHS